MASKVGNDFKQAFALLLSVMKINYSTSNAMNYSQTLYEWTLSGLITDSKLKQSIEIAEDGGKSIKLSALEPKYEKYVDEFYFARDKYMEAVDIIKNPAASGLKNWSQSQIFSSCFEINQAILPIALSEGYLDLKDIAAGIGAGAGGIPMGKDS